MAESGIPADLNKVDIVDAFMRNNGNVSKSAKDLNVSTQTIYVYIGKYPDLEDRLYEIRKAKYVERCDVSEAKLDELLVSKDSPNVSYNVAKYYLETHGKKRGYSKSAESVQPPNDEIINLRIENAKLQAENERMKLNGSESKTGEKHCGSE